MSQVLQQRPGAYLISLFDGFRSHRRGRIELSAAADLGVRLSLIKRRQVAVAFQGRGLR